VLCLKIDAVRRNPLTSKATDDKVEKEVKEWLKFAAERDGKRRQRDLMNKSATKRKSVNRRRSSDREQSIERGASAAGSSHESGYHKKLSIPLPSASKPPVHDSLATHSPNRESSVSPSMATQPAPDLTN
jgi:hypothetical protein